MLVVEDDADTRDMLQRMLTRENWAVIEATNGRVALERMAESQPELILLDLMMPEMDGFGFLEALRQLDAWRSIPVVVVGEGPHGGPPASQRLRGTDPPEGAYSREELFQRLPPGGGLRPVRTFRHSGDFVTDNHIETNGITHVQGD